jgi:flagellar assembly factor FliW
VIESGNQEVLHFPEGLVGFENLHEYVLYRSEAYEPFAWLISVEDPEIAFAVADPEYFVRDSYVLTIGEPDRRLLDLKDQDPVEVYIIASPSSVDRGVTGNLKAPVVLNVRNRTGKQILLYSSRFSTRQPLRRPHALTVDAGEDRRRTLVRASARKVA